MDVQHIKLELSVDMKLKLIKGSCITDFKGLAPSADRVSFDAIDLNVSGSHANAASVRILDSTTNSLPANPTPPPASSRLNRIYVC